ncbi:MAG: HipA domain-containing protein [Gammaproteobacteria bacterium]|nr:HipA domain-containing protein [Gammaproteobacteria bacterium]
MEKEITLQLCIHGQWVDAAQIALLQSEGQGVLAPVYIAYSTNWAVEHAGSAGIPALATQYPVSLQHMQRQHWPAFLVDLLPQGYGRAELLRQLDRKPTSGPESDWLLLQHGAGNPIGHMRVKQAAEWLEQQTTPLQGFHDQEIVDRAESFVEHLAQFGLFVAGSSGVQGEWPKLLLTRGKDTKLYLDHSLPDEQAATHYIVKFSRGPNPRLASILRHEAAYMQIAKLAGLRVSALPTYNNGVLFIPRFDRTVQAGEVNRHAQESLASLLDIAGFDSNPNHNEACLAISKHCANPLPELAEYICRDVLNLALGNKDNHARNTAFTRNMQGNLQLTPLFDFAPMVLHPDGIARRMRWQDENASAPRWADVISFVEQLQPGATLYLVERLRSLIKPLATIDKQPSKYGIEPALFQLIGQHLKAQIKALQALEASK